MSEEQKKNPTASAGTVFAALQGALEDGGTERAFQELVAELERQKKYQELFEAMVMRSRHELGLPLIQIGPATEIPDDLVASHEDAIAEACKRVGRLFLADGDLVKAWPYLRAIGDNDSMAGAIKKLEPGTRRKDIDSIIEIAVNERVEPRRGLEMVVHHYGICSAITNFEQFHLSFSARVQQECASLLLHTLYRELLENVRAEADRSDSKVESEPGLLDLIRSHPELFEEDAYYIDTSHLWSVVRFASFITDPEDLSMAIELTEYGRRLSSVYKYDSEPPFEDYYPDHALYFQGIRGNVLGNREDSERAAAHFISKAKRAIAEKTRDYPVQGVLTVLVRLGRFHEAIDLALECEAAGMGRCQQPSLLELCQLAEDYDRLMEVARERNDTVGFAAGLIQKRAASSSRARGGESGASP